MRKTVEPSRTTAGKRAGCQREQTTLQPRPDKHDRDQPDGRLERRCPASFGLQKLARVGQPVVEHAVRHDEQAESGKGDGDEREAAAARQPDQQMLSSAHPLIPSLPDSPAKPDARLRMSPSERWVIYGEPSPA